MAVHAFWREITSLGPQHGYNRNAAKTKLLVKPGLEGEARILFADTPIDIQTDGVRYLGGAIGTHEYITGSLCRHVALWSKEVRALALFARTQPYAIYQRPAWEVALSSAIPQRPRICLF